MDLALLNKPGVLPRIRFGTWVGGDRDGHPGVTAEITAETLDATAGECAFRGAQSARRAGGKCRSPRGCSRLPQLLLDAIARTEAKLGDAAPKPRPASEPWQQFCGPARCAAAARSAGWRAGAGRGALSIPIELLADLDLLTQALAVARAQRLARSDVRPVRRSSEVFGFHLAQLDVRQNCASFTPRR